MTFLDQSSGTPGLVHILRDIFVHTLLLCEQRTLHFLTKDLLEFMRPQVSASQD